MKWRFTLLLAGIALAALAKPRVALLLVSIAIACAGAFWLVVMLMGDKPKRPPE